MGLHRSLIFVLLGAVLSSCFLKYECRYLEGYKFPVYTTEFCPRNQPEWNERSSSINCNDSNGYMCMPNENITKLIEFCFPAPFTWIEEGICLVLHRRNSEFLSYKCSQFWSGCPSSSYSSDKSFEHPNCTAIRNGCFLAETNCSSTTPSHLRITTEPLQSENITTHDRKQNVTNYSTKSTEHAENDRLFIYLLPISFGIVALICFLFALSIYFIRRIPSQKEREIEIHSEEEINPPIQQEQQIDTRNSSGIPSQKEYEIEIHSEEEINPLIQQEQQIDTRNSSGNPSRKECVIEIHSEKEINPLIEQEQQIDKRNSSVGCLLEEDNDNEMYQNNHGDISTSTDEQTNKEDGSTNESRLDRAIFKLWQDDNKFFIPTKASEEVEELIKSQNLVIVTGHSGSGKSAIIQHIALKCRNSGWIVKQIDKVSEFLKEFNKLNEFSQGNKMKNSNKTLFVFNDPIGTTSIDKMKLNKWETCEVKLKASLKEVKLIVSCRKYILNDDRVRGLLKDTSNIVDISQDQLKLNNDEKQEIWNIYSSNKISYPKDISEIVNIDAYFPLLCKLYFSNDRNRTDGLRFFKEPREVLEEEIKSFKSCSKEKYCALVLLVLFNGVLDVDAIPKTETSKGKFKLALKICEVNQNLPRHTIADILNNLNGFLVKKIGDIYHFYHDFVMEVTTYVFGKCYPEAMIEYADICFLRKNLRLQSTDKQNNPLTLTLHNTNKADLGKRLCCEIFGKDLLDVVLNPCLKDEKVIDAFINELSHNSLKLEKLLEKKKLQIEDENLNELPEAKKLISSKFAFMKLENETSPLNALIVFGHTEISLHCLIVLKFMSISFKDQLLFSSVCCNGSLEMFSVLLEDGIQECLTEKWGTLFPIYIASTFHNYEILNEVMDYHKHLDIKVDNKDGWTLLMLAAAYDSCEFDENFKEKTDETKRNETVQLILRNGANINQCDKEGTSPLYVACQEGHDSTVKLLLEYGANINLRDKDGTSPLFVACQEGHNSTVQILLSKGAEINLCDKDGTSPLFVACQEGHNSTVQLLLNNGAEINLCDNEGTNPLSVACQEGHELTVELLLNKGAEIGLCDREKASPLFVACQEGYERIVQLLLSKGAEINECDEEGMSPLFIACQEGHQSTVELLLKKGADVNLCDEDGTSPLYIACQEGHKNTVQLLLKNEAAINSCDKNRVSPLFIACRKGYDAIVKLLIDKGADINLSEINGISPLYVAFAWRHCVTVNILLECGANTSVLHGCGSNSLSIDCFNKDEQTILFLLQKNNIIDNIYDLDSFFTLFVFCQVEQMLRMSE